MILIVVITIIIRVCIIYRAMICEYIYIMLIAIYYYYHEQYCFHVYSCYY